MTDQTPATAMPAVLDPPAATTPAAGTVHPAGPQVNVQAGDGTPLITVDIVKKICPQGKMTLIAPMVKAFNTYASNPRYDVTAPIQVAMFFAQMAVETDSFRTLEEYASGDAYEGRKDLGNTKRGDGRRFKGRGGFDLTGRANYEAMSHTLGLDLVNHPEQAEDPTVGVVISLEYWRSRHLNDLAANDNVLGVSTGINGRNRTTGLPNGWPDRQKMTDQFCEALGA